jgi:hypothetical protein
MQARRSERQHGKKTDLLTYDSGQQPLIHGRAAGSSMLKKNKKKIVLAI